MTQVKTVHINGVRAQVRIIPNLVRKPGQAIKVAYGQWQSWQRVELHAAGRVQVLCRSCAKQEDCLTRASVAQFKDVGVEAVITTCPLYEELADFDFLDGANDNQ